MDLYNSNWAAPFSSAEERAANQAPHRAARYTVNLVVVGSSIVSNSRIWQLQFVPGKDAPRALRNDRCQVWVGDADRRVVRVVHHLGASSSEVSLTQVEGMVLMRHPPGAFPVQLLPILRSEETSLVKTNRGRRVSIARTKVLGTETLEARLDGVLRDGGLRNDVVVKQIWGSGAKWWTTYETHIRGHIQTRAWLGSAPADEGISPPEPKQP